MSSAQTLIVLAAILFACVAIFVSVAVVSRRRPGRYTQKKLLTEVEQVLYWRLKEALPECVILCQVTFSRFMRPDAGIGATQGRFMTLQNRISDKTVDFLICLQDFTVVAALELEDPSQDSEKGSEGDRPLESAGIAIVRMNVGNLPSIERIREMFMKRGS